MGYSDTACSPVSALLLPPEVEALLSHASMPLPPQGSLPERRISSEISYLFNRFCPPSPSLLCTLECWTALRLWVLKLLTCIRSDEIYLTSFSTCGCFCRPAVPENIQAKLNSDYAANPLQPFGDGGESQVPLNKFVSIEAGDPAGVPLPRQQHGCAVIGSNMFIIGGSYGGRSLRDIQVGRPQQAV